MSKKWDGTIFEGLREKDRERMALSVVSSVVRNRKMLTSGRWKESDAFEALLYLVDKKIGLDL